MKLNRDHKSYKYYIKYILKDYCILILVATSQKRWQGAFGGELKRPHKAAGVSFPGSRNCSNSLLRYSVLCEHFRYPNLLHLEANIRIYVFKFVASQMEILKQVEAT